MDGALERITSVARVNFFEYKTPHFAQMEMERNIGRMLKKTIPSLVIAFSVTAAVVPLLQGDTVGISVNGTCEAGSCPPRRSRSTQL